MKKIKPNWSIVIGCVIGVFVLASVILETIFYIKFWGTPFNELPGWAQWLLWFMR